MTNEVLIFTADPYLFLKVSVFCRRLGLTLTKIEDEEQNCEMLIWDVDIKGGKRYPVGTYSNLLLLCHEDGTDKCIHLPIDNEALLSFLERKEITQGLSLSQKDRVATIYGESVRLTEVESSLLAYLLNKQGECATNEELVKEIWGGDASASAVNVYIHYLREKLELRGERIILVRRGKGYYIEEKFLKGAVLC